jgi:hypothetical protein
MTAAVYDNPATMRREGWQDGRLEGFVSRSLMESRGFRESGLMPWWLNVGNWSPGKVHGDPCAVGPLNTVLGMP